MLCRHELLTHVDKSGVVSCTQVVQNGRFIQVGQISHVVNFLELGRIHLLDRVFLDRFLLRPSTITMHQRLCDTHTMVIINTHICKKNCSLYTLLTATPNVPHSFNASLKPTYFTNLAHRRHSFRLMSDSTDFLTGPFLLSKSDFCFYNRTLMHYANGQKTGKRLAEDWQIKFNVSKCKVMHTGPGNTNGS